MHRIEASGIGSVMVMVRQYSKNLHYDTKYHNATQ